MKSKLGMEVIDAHAHFFTVETLKSWKLRGRTLDGFSKRIQTRTDMNSIVLPDETWDVAKKWVEEMDRYGITAMGFMVGKEAYDEYLEAKNRFPGRFMGYANINPGEEDAVQRVKEASKDGFQGIKLYPSSWKNFHTYDEVCYPVYEEAQRHKLLVLLHFGITIGSQANLRYGNPLDIQLPSRDFPDLTFIIVHFGAGFFREVLLLQYQTDNVLIDTSGSNSWLKYLPYDLDIRKVFEKSIRAAGPEKIIFGTDSTFFPRGFRFNILKEQYQALKSLSRQSRPILSKDDIDSIFRRNILKLTGFKPSV